MDSKGEQLWNLYQVSNQSYANTKRLDEEINSLRVELDAHKQKRQLYDYNNPQVIADSIEQSIEGMTEEREQQVHDIIERQIVDLRKQEERLRRNYLRFSGWYSSKKSADKVVRNSKPYEYKTEKDAKADNYALVANSFWKWFFLGLLMILVVGPAVWIYKLAKKVLDFFLDLGIIDTIIGVVIGILSIPMWWSIMATLFQKNPKVMITVIIVSSVLATIFFIVQIILSHQALSNEADKFLAIFYPDEYREKGYKSMMDEFHAKTNQWRSDVERFKAGDHVEFAESFIEQNRNICAGIDAEIESLNNQIAQKESELQSERDKLDEAQKSISECKVGIKSAIKDVNHNEGVLTEYVCFKRAEYNLSRHSLLPMVFVYESNSSSEIQRESAVFTSDFYSGLICENHFSIIDYYVIDFETGGGFLSHDDDARHLLELKMLNVVHDNHGRDALYQKLRNQKERIVGAGGTGDISTINPSRIKDGDVPFKYFVVLHCGKEARNITSDLLQLYKSSSKFGFLPVFIMSDSEYKEIMSNENSVLKEVIKESAVIHSEY